MSTPKKNSAAAKLSKLGAAKGGQARANTLTPEERSEIARQAVQARWAKKGKQPQTKPVPAPQPDYSPNPTEPISLFRGTLTIGSQEVECHVLDDGRRVFTQREIVRVLSGRASGDLKTYLANIPAMPSKFGEDQNIVFKIPGNPTLAIGREATTVMEICEKYLEARDQKLLKPSQEKLADAAEIIIRASAKVGIIALIDEATGYQKVRAQNALRLKLQAFIAEDLQEWARMFPQEFWFELARLEGIRYTPRSRPLRWGRYVMRFVYDALDPDIGKELRKRNPNPHYRRNHHQWLKEYGRQKVDVQINKVITIMKLCENMDEFKQKFAKVFQETPLQTSFDEIEWGTETAGPAKPTAQIRTTAQRSSSKSS